MCPPVCSPEPEGYKLVAQASGEDSVGLCWIRETLARMFKLTIKRGLAQLCWLLNKCGLRLIQCIVSCHHFDLGMSDVLTISQCQQQQSDLEQVSGSHTPRCPICLYTLRSAQMRFMLSSGKENRNSWCLGYYVVRYKHVTVQLLTFGSVSADWPIYFWIWQN